jgi:hypothetical protein
VACPTRVNERCAFGNPEGLASLEQRRITIKKKEETKEKGQEI